jgi:hypothetical protein
LLELKICSKQKKKKKHGRENRKPKTERTREKIKNKNRIQMGRSPLAPPRVRALLRPAAGREIRIGPCGPPTFQHPLRQYIKPVTVGFRRWPALDFPD